jgi:hypothetical protein
MDKDRQIYQLHKKGYEDLVKAIDKMKLEVDIQVTVKDAVVNDIKLEDEQENPEN